MGERRYGTVISASSIPEVEYRPPVKRWTAGSASGLPVRPAALTGGMGQAARAQLRHLDEPLVAVALRRIEVCTNQKTDREAAMRQFMMTLMALAALGAMVVTAQAENQKRSPPTPSHPVKNRTVSQTTRSSQAVGAAHSTCTGMKPQCFLDCYFAGAPPSQVCEVLLRSPSAAAGNFWCTPHGVNLTQLHQIIDPYCETVCNFQWEQCMKTGFWEGYFQHRPAERR